MQQTVATVLATTIAARQLSLVDRISLMAFLFSLALLIAYQAHLEAARTALFNATAFALAGISLFCLLVAWLYNRFQHRRRGHRLRPGSHVTAQ
jgi:hypothetical protein